MSQVVFLKSRANFRGGLEKATHHLMQAFAGSGCAVTLLTTGAPPKIPGVRILSLAPSSKCTLYHLVHFNSLCKKWLANNPHEIVFGMERTTTQTHYRAGNGVHAVYLNRRKLIDSPLKTLSVGINPLHKILLAMEKKAFESPDLKVLFTNSYMVRGEILNHYATLPEKIQVVHNGVEWESWSNEFESTFSAKKQGPYELLFVGNGYKRKGLFFLLQALALMKTQDFHLTVIGKEKNLAYFITLVTKLGLKERVSFKGTQENILPYYKAADALVIPSIYDPFANVTVEALAMGLYVVSSAFNGGKEVLQKYSGTVIEDLSSIESICVALKKAFAHPKTEESARRIRYSIKELDFSRQLDKIVHKTLQNL